MDIVLAVVLFLVISATGYLGMHLTLHPAETPQAKRKYKFWFGVLTLAAIGLIIWQSVLNRNEQGYLHSQLNKIQHNTETPPMVNVEAPQPPSPPPPHTTVAWVHMSDPHLPQPGPLLPFTENEQPTVNMGFLNAGNFAVTPVKAQGALLLLPFARVPTEEYRKSINAILRSEGHPGGTLVPHEPTISYNTYTGPKLSGQDAADLNSGMKMLCAIAVLTWTDATGIYRTSFIECTYHEPGDGFNWHSGVEDNHEEKLKY